MKLYLKVHVPVLKTAVAPVPGGHSTATYSTTFPKLRDQARLADHS